MNKKRQTILLGILTALLFSAFIYFEHYHLTNKFINTLFGLVSLALFLYIPKRSVLVAGFFIGLLWFYWIGYSFKYQGVAYMTPIITFSFGLIYLLFFMPLSFTNKAYIRAFLLFGLSFFYPFNWNWLQIELIFVDSYIGIYKYDLALILFSLSLPQLFKTHYKYLPLLLIILTFNPTYPKQKDAPLKIKLIQTDIKQEYKWTRTALTPTIQMIYKNIQSAIDTNYDVIVFPESVFPLYLNKNPKLIQTLLLASHDITILAGALLLEHRQSYNVTYMFQNGTYQLAKKVVLVPFGEYIPLPKFARKFINDTFFSGASDFLSAEKPTDFIIKGIKFRNAICYEATTQIVYDGDVHYIIATSNNAWFAPSIEPTIQKLLLEYYGRKNGVSIYHSANYAGSGFIH